MALSLPAGKISCMVHVSKFLFPIFALLPFLTKREGYEGEKKAGAHAVLALLNFFIRKALKTPDCRSHGRPAPSPTRTRASILSPKDCKYRTALHPTKALIYHAYFRLSC